MNKSSPPISALRHLPALAAGLLCVLASCSSTFCKVDKKYSIRPATSFVRTAGGGEDQNSRIVGFWVMRDVPVAGQVNIEGVRTQMGTEPRHFEVWEEGRNVAEWEVTLQVKDQHLDRLCMWLEVTYTGTDGEAQVLYAAVKAFRDTASQRTPPPPESEYNFFDSAGELAELNKWLNEQYEYACGAVISKEETFYD